ncbi:sigma-70 family RNA polymerase sigma factor [Limnoglobus roseus]|uniref:sigma-70 family RNA polymerase sigma factor n=1 Tax=Limnoglobus roseus TaxID=2598579 RepID=UPI00143DACAD|nr:sigma-70 family RNA polymerase sigma factor [Limnoglobus roseus]
MSRLQRAATLREFSPQSCGDLLEAFVARRDAAAFAELVRRHGPKVYAVCRRVIGHHQTAEDAYQAVFVILARKAHTVRPRSAVGGFLYGVARHAALRALSMNRRRKETLAGEVPDCAADQSIPVDPDVLVMLDEEIANLSDAYRAAVVLCELDGVSRADAARQLGVAEGTVSSRLAAARKQLAARLAKRGVAFSAGLFVALSESAGATLPPFLEPTVALLPPTVSAIAAGVMRTMILSKLKAAVTLGVLLTAFAAWSFVPSAAPNANAAPAPTPRAEKDDAGLIWTWDMASGTLTAFAEDGTKEREVALKAARHFQGFGADGETLLFLAKKGQLTDDESGLTLHFGKPDDLAAATDTGIAYKANDGYLLTRDKKRVVRHELTQVGRVGANPQPKLFRHTLIDLKDKNETVIELPDSAQIMWESRDGKEWIAMVYSLGADPKLPGYRYLRIPKAGGQPTPICDTHHFVFFEPSPDGRSYLGIGVAFPPPGDAEAFSLYHLTAGGKATELEQFADFEQRNLFWSPGGKRYVMKKLGDADVFVADADGKNRKKLFAIPDAGKQTHVVGWLPAKKKIAALPKPDGLIWTYNAVSGKLVGYAPDGTTARELTLTDGALFLGLTPDGERILYAGVKGKLPANPKDPPGGLTLHLRPLGEADAGTDLGVPWHPKNEGIPFHFSQDGRTFVYSPLASPDQEFSSPRKHFRVDLATKTATEVAFSAGGEFIALSPDGRWAIGNINGKVHKVPLNGDRTTPVADYCLIHTAAFTPDGKSVLFCGERAARQPGQREYRSAVWALDLAANRVTELASAVNAADFRGAFWSPDGQQVVFGSTRLTPASSTPDTVEAAKGGQPGQPSPLAFNQAEYRIVVGDPQGKVVKMWSVQDLEKEKEQEGYTQLLGWFPAKKKIAAPPPEAGTIWTYDYKTGDLTAYSPAGKQEKTLKLKDGRQFLGMTPDGKKLAFVGISGKLVPPGSGPALTVHLRDVNDSTDGESTGIDYLPGDQFVWANDGTRVIRERPGAVLFSGASDLPAFDHTLIDLATKKEIKPEGVGLHEQVIGWGPDDSWLLLAQYTGKVRAGAVTSFRTKLHRFAFDTKRSKALGEELQVYNPVVAPDGRTLFGVGCQLTDATDLQRCAMVRIELSTGKTTEVVHHKGQGFAAGRWSPDGRRVAYIWTDAASPDQATLEIRDADGGNAMTVTISTPAQGQPEVAVLGWFPTARKKISVPPPSPTDVKAAFLKAAGDSAAAVALFDRVAADPHRLAVLTEAVQDPRRTGDLYAAELWRVWRAAASPSAPEGGVPAADAAVCLFLGGDPTTADVLRNYPVPADATEGFRTHETVILSTAVNLELFAKDRKEPFGHLIAGWAAARSDPWARGSAIETARTYRLAAMIPLARRLAADVKAEARFRLAAVTLLADLGGTAERDVLVKLLDDKSECDSRTLTIKGEAAPTVTRQVRDVALGCLLVMDGAKIAAVGFDEFDFWKPDYRTPAEYFRLAPFGFVNDDSRGRAHAKAAAILKAPLPKEKPAAPGTIAFFQQSVGQLRLIDSDGGNERTLKEIAVSDQVRLSPNGKQVAYLVFGGERGTRAEVPRRVFVRAIDGGGPGTDLGVLGRHLAWSPDGKKLAVTDYDNPPPPAVFEATHVIVEVATKETTDLKLPKGNILLDWSADGKQFLTEQVVTKAGKPQNNRLVLLPAAGEEVRALGPVRDTITGGRFSPDGKFILALGTGAGKPGEAFRKVPVLIDVATNKVTPVPKVDDKADAESVCWSPDGKRLAYSWKVRPGGTLEVLAGADTESRVTVCDRDGTNAKQLATTTAAGAFTVIFGSLDWR